MMTPPPGHFLEQCSYDYKKMPKMKVMTASQEATEMEHERQQQIKQELTTFNQESVSTAVILKRKHKQEIQRYFPQKNESDDDSLIFENNQFVDDTINKDKDVEKETELEHSLKIEDSKSNGLFKKASWPERINEQQQINKDSLNELVDHQTVEHFEQPNIVGGQNTLNVANQLNIAPTLEFIPMFSNENEVK